VRCAAKVGPGQYEFYLPGERATDVNGKVQPREAAWNQSGYLHNSWHFVDVEVTS